MTSRVTHHPRHAELEKRVVRTLQLAGLTRFPSRDEGEDPGGFTTNIVEEGVALGWFTSDDLTDSEGSAADSAFVQACNNTMVGAIASILLAAGYSVTVNPWEFDGDEGGISALVCPR